MNSKPLVSIALLCYNHEKYIKKAIESVLLQTYKNIELVIVDNASADNSLNLIKSLVGDNLSVRIVELEENTFPSYGWNYAAKLCKGDYIASLSGDDYFEYNKVEQQLDYMLTNDLFNSFTWVNCVDDNNNILDEHSLTKLFNRDFSNNELRRVLLTEGNTLCATSFMFHRSLFKKYGYYDHRLLQSQDYDFWLRIIKYEDIYILPYRLTNYRVRNDESNLSIKMDDTSRKRSIFESINFLKIICSFNLDVLSSITEEVCTEENKYNNLFKFYIKIDQPLYALAVIFAMYEELGTSFDFPSIEYKYFFELYSDYDLLNILENENLKKTIHSKDLQIIELNNLIKSQNSMSYKELLKIFIKKLLKKV